MEGVDLAAALVGGKAVAASDEFFAPKENLLKPGRGIFIPEKYTANGKWMDGWETRRKRTPGHDWCIIALGMPGSVTGVDIDTNHFLGNNPAYASVDAAASVDPRSSLLSLPGGARGPRGPKAPGGPQWTEILARVPLKPGSQNLFPVADSRRWTHLRLNIFPDGGVARFRAYGSVLPDWEKLAGKPVDLAGVANGGVVVAASDMFFGSKENLILPGRALTMGEGWETRRRRGAGHDWAVVRLGRPGAIRSIEVDTNHFKGNYPDRCSIDVLDEGAPAVDALNAHLLPWREIVPVTGLSPHNRRRFAIPAKAAPRAAYVRLNIYPDGGVSRLRVVGTFK